MDIHENTPRIKRVSSGLSFKGEEERASFSLTLCLFLILINRRY